MCLNLAEHARSPIKLNANVNTELMPLTSCMFLWLWRYAENVVTLCQVRRPLDDELRYLFSFTTRISANIYDSGILTNIKKQFPPLITSQIHA